ncbi:cell division protein ZapA [Brucepastera parasyntrophica]|uniref:cell division protein ZapA n=1 Tax=Brucepastera parasyntrophica TaxID=2880008 RepID=UPI00210CE527|nr:cell division protein ZapA [Brucepastera parasyntrophica]ULQ60187.1 cell division protein ZapA [Brucepastera parasyntrophica]
MSKGNLQIDLLGTSFAIQADEKPEYLNVLYSYYKKTVEKVESTPGLTDPLKIAIISGIFLADELYKEKMKSRELRSGTQDIEEVEKITLQMISLIDQVIE